ncbi:hypothetical protein CFN78_21825 [Amycolatopsis antarctica]|uniref:Uncharacterized protein n=2 Tax=Amycolatopsis antarctica TaxID=1854586 RepID=A0A263CYY3_9PSEU|nr:hypothetical protein CFN78_21825 [Amycolatopsis antarctica]
MMIRSGVAVAALGIAVSVPGAAVAAGPATVNAPSPVTTQATWVYHKWYPTSAAALCKLEGQRFYPGRYQCRNSVQRRVELWVRY